ncbi:hypothetical protein UC8_54720 [Roseimaritima ulvae]|uniref:Uncharacterized protein n=1 Tax=Roseimaritima ulvae TaxID=980254 RepID=A0A5B9R9D9_9BACT|nr:hypothetical protein UC8_54720 [Roseimaritima ulvae]
MCSELILQNANQCPVSRPKNSSTQFGNRKSDHEFRMVHPLMQTTFAVESRKQTSDT